MSKKTNIYFVTISLKEDDDMSYTFDKKIEQKHIELINKAIDVCNSLNAPIAKNVYFKYCIGCSRYGWCRFDGDLMKYVIAINKYIIEDNEFIRTTIHELLHTINNYDYSPHKGEWKRWAEIISNNSKYKITVTSTKKLKKEAYSIVDKRENEPKTICYCPFCRRKYYVKTKSIYKHKSTYYCNYCKKDLYDELPDSILKEMSNNERNLYLERRIISKDISKEELFDFLNYTDKSMTRNLIRYYISYLPIELKDSLKGISKYVYEEDFKNELAMNYIRGCYDDYIKTEHQFFVFDEFFPLTQYWNMINEYYKSRNSNRFHFVKHIRNLNEKFYIDLLKCRFLNRFIEIISDDSLINITFDDITQFFNGNIVGVIDHCYNDFKTSYEIWPIICNKKATDVILNVVSKSSFKINYLDNIIKIIKSQFGEINIIFSHSINEKLLPLYSIRALFVSTE